MKKFFFIAAMVSAALISCTKNEPAPSVDAPQEITFMTAPVTKAPTAFATDKKFISYAYLLTDNKAWDGNQSDATPYIENKLIEYISGKNYWANASTTYYWPRDAKSKLTFFAWTDNTAEPNATDKKQASCDQTTGIKFTDYNVTTIKNRDIMVAKIAANKTANEGPMTGASWEAGVPTVFYHILSQIKVNIKLKEEYSSASFKLNSITLMGVTTEGTYTQGVNSATLPTAGTWVESATTGNLPLYSVAAGMDVTTTNTPVTPGTDDYSIVLPQAFSAATEKVQIVYTITTEYAGTAVNEVVTVEKYLDEIFTEEWLAGKYYTLNITIGLNQILWDPAVEDWAEGTSYGWNI